MFKKILLGLVLFHITFGIANADGWNTAPTKVRKLYIWANADMSGRNFLVQFEEMVNPDSCNINPTWSWMVIQTTHPLYYEMITLLLTVKVNGGSVKYFVSGCTGGGYPIITAISEG